MHPWHAETLVLAISDVRRPSYQERSTQERRNTGPPRTQQDAGSFSARSGTCRAVQFDHDPESQSHRVTRVLSQTTPGPLPDSQTPPSPVSQSPSLPVSQTLRQRNKRLSTFPHPPLRLCAFAVSVWARPRRIWLAGWLFACFGWSLLEFAGESLFALATDPKPWHDPGQKWHHILASLAPANGHTWPNAPTAPSPVSAAYKLIILKEAKGTNGQGKKRADSTHLSGDLGYLSTSTRAREQHSSRALYLTDSLAFHMEHVKCRLTVSVRYIYRALCEGTLRNTMKVTVLIMPTVQFRVLVH